MDTYFDKVHRSNTATYLDHEDPRYFNGCLYTNTITRNVAKAKHNLEMELHYLVGREKYHIQRAFEKARAK